MIIPEDSHWMSRALTLAERGAGETNPNPMVGCVVMKGSHMIAEGYHRCAGGPHAEIVALESAGSRASGATLYVNLEPCAHQGRTPPCAPRIVAAGVRRVVVATRDPHPLVDGRGLAYLRQAGVGVDVGVLSSRAAWLNRFFFVAQRYSRPYVLLKAAITLDARIATRAGDSKWITSGAQRNAAGAMRRLFGGVLIGVGTVLRDDPVLLPRPSVHRPFHRIVLDSRLRTPLHSRLVRSARRSPVILVHARAGERRRKSLAAAGVDVLRLSGEGGRLSPRRCMGALWRRGITSVMVEGGSEVLGSFLAARLFDEIVFFRAPLILGGRESRPVFGGPNPRSLSRAARVTITNPLLAGPHEADESFERWFPRRGSLANLARYWRSSRTLA